MDLSLITQVTCTDEEREASRLLSQGWVLLKVADGKRDDGYPVIWYSLGFPGAEEGGEEKAK